MRAYPVFAAGLFFLVTVAPQPSVAQSPTARAAVQAAKHVPRFMWHYGEGVTIDPPFEWRGRYFGGKVDKFKFPPPQKMWDGFVGSMGLIGGAGWLCDHFGWCHKQK